MGVWFKPHTPAGSSAWNSSFFWFFSSRASLFASASFSRWMSRSLYAFRLCTLEFLPISTPRPQEARRCAQS